MSRLSGPAVAVATAFLVTASASARAGDAPTATAAKSCKVRDPQSYGTTYVLWIRGRRVSCRKARERVRAFHDCRKGDRGRCPDVGAWTCHENRTAGSGSYDSVVRCRHNRKRVRHRYTQWT